MKCELSGSYFYLILTVLDHVFVALIVAVVRSTRDAGSALSFGFQQPMEGAKFSKIIGKRLITAETNAVERVISQ